MKLLCSLAVAFSLLMFGGFGCSESPRSSILPLFQDSLQMAGKENKKLIVLFSADWCPDCNALDRILTSDSRIKELITNHYIILKVDVGRFDQNLDLDERLEHPIGKGIPALVILNPSETIIATTKGGEFSNASKMSNEQVLNYLNRFAN
ncbi:thioredoxin family protein [Leptospira idonii]|uniref:Thioredoxin family protein n=1 Tax=Leptospira idonii TaxID=1193500 RepID=A0A4R9M5D0_9LEPT|nr:thioredoxin family protein [Leptospira idonii]TGN20917.1 thioredoxin family protein [Leptospira idonii]